jgi:ketosteroid isomerase-like protein
LESTETRNLGIVGGIYEAFGRGDIPAILEALAEDVSWESWADHAGQKAGVPWLQERRGRDGALAFFQIIGAWIPNDFQVLALMAGGNSVAAECQVDFTLPSGARLRDEEVHLWTLNAEGRVTRFRHYSDTAKHIEAAR